MTSCRTAVLGGHLLRCSACDYCEQAYNSCWNRHCPKCQGGAAFAWSAARAAELLPVPYFHLVFTQPHELNELCYANKAVCYDILFRASSETLLDVSRNNLSLHLGFFGVLHTWNQELLYHPHLHYVVPGGGLNNAGHWSRLPQGSKFLLPVRILSRVFRGKYIAYLKEAYGAGCLYLRGNIEYLNDPRAFEELLSRACMHEWNVYAKRPFAGPEVVVKYLSSYTHRVGISNSRLRELTADTVSFSARDRERPGKKRCITISQHTFVCRFLQHILPKGFRRIRYFGFMCPAQKAAALVAIRADLKTLLPPCLEVPLARCPSCQKANLRLVELYNPHRIPRRHWFPSLPASPTRCLSPPPILQCQ